MFNDVPTTSHGRQPFRSFYLSTVYHTEFDPDWPISTDWPAVVRGLRGSLHRSQAEFASLLHLGRATVERWETGRTQPYRGDAIEVLNIIRPKLETPVQAGQALNLAASAVLPHLTRPTAQYRGRNLTAHLRSPKGDHSDLARPLLRALVTARILVTIDPENDELDDLYFPLAGRAHLAASPDAPTWSQAHLDHLHRMTSEDRQLVLEIAERLATSPGPATDRPSPSGLQYRGQTA